MKFSGILRPLFESLRTSPKARADFLIGQEVKTSRRDVKTLIALDADQNVHFLVSPAPASDVRFRRFRLRTFRIEIREWSIARQASQGYLDVWCVTGGQPALLRPFLGFCEDLLVDLDDSTVSAEDAVFRAAQRWYRFWSKESSAKLSLQAVRGLIGELTFLKYLADRNGPGAVRTWAGPEGRDHDFQTGHEVAVEVKSSASIPYRIECNLNQLDPGLFHDLFLVCFLVQEADAGSSLVDVVDSLRVRLAHDERALEEFDEKLMLAGYQQKDESEYGIRRFSIAPPEVFVVDGSFPRITMTSFVEAPDMRILDVRYVLEVTGLPGIAPEAAVLSRFLAKLSGRD